MVHDESWSDVSIHGFWKCGTSAIFDMQVFNLYAGSYLQQTSGKALATAEKEKMYKYLQTCMERRRSFTPMVYSRDGIPGTEATMAHRHLASLLGNKLKQEYLEIYSFVRARMLLAIVRFNTLLLQGARDKELYIHQRPDMADGTVVVMLAPWRG